MIMNIYLKELEHTDLISINNWRNDHAIMDKLGGVYRFISTPIDQKWYESYLLNRQNNIRLSIFSENNSQLLGVVYLLNIDWIVRSAEFAICIGEIEAQGKGVGESATRLILDHAFKDLNLQRVYLTVLETNTRAINLYKKVGFIEEGRLRKAAFKNGHYVDLIQMAVFVGEVNVMKKIKI